jgi:hypothetical protein
LLFRFRRARRERLRIRGFGQRGEARLGFGEQRGQRLGRTRCLRATS